MHYMRALAKMTIILIVIFVLIDLVKKELLARSEMDRQAPRGSSNKLTSLARSIVYSVSKAGTTSTMPLLCCGYRVLQVHGRSKTHLHVLLLLLFGEGDSSHF